ncbi:MAG: glycoside hydrolase family 3 N-terminal domain-containing protein [Gammaproteobacteria bacterium]|tara:strand:- start:11094 stop:13019 length:1926 start_codon:yes stop_codon:yes gene_type:complete
MGSSVFSRIFLVSLFVISVLIVNFIFSPIERVIYLAKLKPEVKTLDIDGMSFRDLNKNNKLDQYEDYRINTAQRVEDLISQMTLEEKVGTLFHPPVTINPDWMFRLYSLFVDGGKLTESEIINQHINHFNLYGNPKPERLAKRLNNLQKIASRSRLGIPVTISSDPIHEVPNGGGVASFSLDGFSKWPSQLGLAASQNPSLVKQFAEIAREEYLAVGIRTALHPMADLATEPRWARNFGTFGSDNVLSSKLTIAYMDGFQGETIDSQSVMTMVKHFPGGGPQENGLDPHLFSGRNQIYPGNMFDYHVKPFIDAINNNLAVIMPYYGITVNQTSENVAVGFNKDLLTTLLRDELGYKGVICSDWGIINGRHWGVGDLSIEERYIKAIDAGIDQFGGEKDTEVVIELVKKGLMPLSRIDASVKRILKNKFDLGLFDNPYVKVDQVKGRVNTERNIKLGREAQKQSMVLLKNDSTLPLEKNINIFVDGFNAKSIVHGNVVSDIKDADVIVSYVHTVFNGNQPSGIDRLVDNVLSSIFPNQDLNFSPEILEKLEEFSSIKPLIVIVDLNRPAILDSINQMSSALVGTFGVDESVIFETLFGESKPTGKLPFEIPSSMKEVNEQLEDVPDDTMNPTFKFGFGLTYP